MKIKIVEINDLHFGIGDTEREKEELKIFLDFIRSHDIDLLEFNGDFFDHKLNMFESAALTGMNFFNEVVSIAIEKNIIIRMIEGTYSHDRFQPKIFDNFIPEDNGKKLINYKFFETIGEEDLLGLKILYIPEEYPMNHDEYYKEYKNKKYDLIFCHGTWDFINFGGMIDNNRNDINTAPVFKYDEWSSALEHGVAICGHIHGRHVFKNKNGTKIIYPGAFTSWSFDQISKRGFLYLEFDTDTKEFHYQFINNDKAPTYANLDVKDLGLDLEKCSIEDIKLKINEQKAKVQNIKINLDSLPLDKKNIFKNLYKDSSGIKIEISPEKFLINKEADDKFAKYSYIIDDKLTQEQVIKKFIKEEMNKDLEESKIKSIITEE